MAKPACKKLANWRLAYGFRGLVHGHRGGEHVTSWQVVSGALAEGFTGRRQAEEGKIDWA